jgi:hypothetical protein
VNEVNPRPAAALALVGWYLMVPPVIKTNSAEYSGYKADFDSPLSRWQVNSAFDSASACNSLSAALVFKGERDMKKTHGLDWAIAQSLTQNQCIATDDPRLKEK